MTDPDHNEWGVIPSVWRWLLDEEPDRIAAAVDGQTNELISILGVPAALKLMAHFAGQQLYVRKLDGAFRPLRDQRIRREFNGRNHAELCRRYNLSESTIFEILRKPDYRQRGLFEEEE